MFNPNIPQPTDKLTVSQGQLLINFNTSNAIFGINHFPFNDGTINAGKHTYVEIVEGPPGGGTPISFPGGEGALYTSVVGGRGELFFGPGSTTAGDPGYQLTGPVAPTPAANGYTFLAGGLIIQWGKTVMTLSGGAGSGNVTFPIAFPNNCFTVVPGLLATINNSSTSNTLSIVNFASGGLNPISRTGFSWLFTGSASANFTNFDWIAIGN